MSYRALFIRYRHTRLGDCPNSGKEVVRRLNIESSGFVDDVGYLCAECLTAPAIISREIKEMSDHGFIDDR